MLNARAVRVSALLLSTFVGSACGGSETLSDDFADSANGATTGPNTPSTPSTPSNGTAGSGSSGNPITFKVRLENVAPFTQLKTGVYNTRVGGSAPGPLAPGEKFEFTFTAGKGQKLALASMFGQSNDWVFSTPPGGIDLYNNGTPISGNITAAISLYDVGTEVDEEPGVGPHTGPNQATSKDGPGAADPDPLVRRLGQTTRLTNGTNFTLPSVAEMICVLITPNAAHGSFTVTIQNVSRDGQTLYTSQGYKNVRISPGVWTLSVGGEPLFTPGKKDRGLGLEDIAESGQVTRLAAALTASTGAATPISPGVFVVHGANVQPLFTTGQRDRGLGLERIAESGNIDPLLTSLRGDLALANSTGSFNTPEGASKPGPAVPGSAFTFEVQARPGDRLSLATMFGWSNDWFFGTSADGIALFDDAGRPLSGDVSSGLRLYDVGTELDEELAIGEHTGPQQTSPDSGLVDVDNRVRPTSTGMPVTRYLKLTLSR